MKQITFVIGGCRSGKSSYALNLAEQVSGQNKIFIATCIPRDKEMEQRVLFHKKERSPDWTTMEVPLFLSEAITDNSRQGNVLLVDCLTLWLNNILMETNDLEIINGHAKKLTQSFEKVRCPVILISNEVGTGIVPENRLARLFRDTAGFLNQRIAACSDKVVWMVAGIPVQIK